MRYTRKQLELLREETLMMNLLLDNVFKIDEKDSSIELKTDNLIRNLYRIHKFAGQGNEFHADITNLLSDYEDLYP